MGVMPTAKNVNPNYIIGDQRNDHLVCQRTLILSYTLARTSFITWPLPMCPLRGAMLMLCVSGYQCQPGHCVQKDLKMFGSSLYPNILLLE